jgi:hypothetical protein
MAGEAAKQCLVVWWQFLLVLWKNFILQIRRPIGTVFELLIPPLAVIVLIGLRLAKMSRPRNSPACSSLKLKLISAPYILMSACNGQVFISVMQQK